MKTWIVILIIGIIIGFIGMMIPTDKTFGITGWYVSGLGLVMIIGAIIAAVTRLWGRMLSD